MNKEKHLCEDCIAEINKIVSELSPEQLAIVKLCNMTPEEYAEYM